MSLDPSLLDADVTGCAASHQRLLAFLDETLDDDLARRPSLLPGWSVGHLVTHIARNADGCRNMLEGAAAGEERPMYPGGLEQRSAEIEAGSGRDAVTLVGDVRRSIWALESTWAGLDADHWNARSSGPFGAIDVWAIPMRRWREVEIHWVDLGLGYGFADWPDAYVDRALPERLVAFPGEVPDSVAAVDPRTRLAWLSSRTTPGEAGLPAAPRWS